MNLIFLSSQQLEFKRFRKEVCYFIRTDPYLSEYFNIFLFENLPANERDPQNNYLNKVKECSIYIGLFGKTYGKENNDGLSATEHEYNYATELKRDRLIFLKKMSKNTIQDVKMTSLINKASQEVTYSTFTTINDLKLEVMKSLLLWQQNHLN